jgi:isoamylase
VVAPGAAAPLGPSPATIDGAPAVNFALLAPAATAVTLVLLDPATRAPAVEHALSKSPGTDVWCVALVGLPRVGVGYGYRVDGRPSPTSRFSPSTLLLDPYAPLVDGRRRFGVRDAAERHVPGVGATRFASTSDFASPPFDWRGDAPPPTPPGKHVVYEVGVRPFPAGGGWTGGAKDEERGTYAGLASRARWLADLGVTAVELLPVFEYDELEFRRAPNPRDHMTNVWGYSHVSFFAPMSRFGGVAAAGDVEARERAGAAVGFGAVAAAAAAELKDAVRALHAAGVAVILDVVYNHTAESDDATPYTLSWRGVDAGAYYQFSPDGALLNATGCGNAVAANEPAGMAMILASLRHWVADYHVDGFRFDLASALTRDARGAPIADPPLIRAIAADPVLSSKLLISEPWDCAGLYQVGSFPNYGVWGEWNGRFRDDVRRFVRGDPGLKPALATRLAGSADLYASRGVPPHANINFVTAHDGFSLADLVSYSAKRNDANGEGGRDGSNDNFSWNCGVEGETGEEGVRALRARVARNHVLTLLLAQGTPMLVSGDEALLSHAGNNNWYGHDGPLAWFDWGAAEGGAGGFVRFVAEAARLRRAHPALARPSFLTPADVTWHEADGDNPDSRFLAFTLHTPPDGGGGDAGGGDGDLYVALNAHPFSVPAPLPAPPPGFTRWARVVDTSLPPPRDVTPGGNAGVEGGEYVVTAHSSIVLMARR